MGNVDSIVFAERPKLAGHRDVIRRRLADMLDVQVDRVSLKAKTGEGVGPIGQEQTIAAQCVVLLVRESKQT